MNKSIRKTLFVTAVALLALLGVIIAPSQPVLAAEAVPPVSQEDSEPDQDEEEDEDVPSARQHRFREDHTFGDGHDMMKMMGAMMSGGMMDGMHPGGMMTPGMVGRTGSTALLGIEPLSIEEAQAAVETFLAGLEDKDLTVGKVLIFENHAYAQVVEESSGVGALEVLVDPITLAVNIEPGPPACGTVSTLRLAA